MFIKKKTISLAVVGVLLLAGTASAEEIDIRRYLIDKGNDVYQVKPADDGSSVEYIQTGNVTLNSYNIVLDSKTVTLIIQGATNMTTFTAKSFKVTDGVLEVKGTPAGSSSLNSSGLQLRDTFTQTGGETTFTGGTAPNAIGMTATTVILSGGTMNAQGGTGNTTIGQAHGIKTTLFEVTGDSYLVATGGAGPGTESYGIYTNGFTLTKGRVVASGKGAANSSTGIPTAEAHGIYVDGDFEQVDGYLEALGGIVGNDTHGSHGIKVTGNFIQSGNGYAEVFSGGTYARGISVDGSFIQSGNGNIIVTTSRAWGAEGIYVGGDFRQTGGGNIDVTGLEAAGIYADAFYMTGTGKVKATGGDGFVATPLTDALGNNINDGQGNIMYGIVSIGVGISTNSFNISSGTLTVTGGNSKSSTVYKTLDLGFAGVKSTTFNQSGGDIVAYGGLGHQYQMAVDTPLTTFSAGIYTSNYTHTAGNLTAYAGGIDDLDSTMVGQNSHGIVVTNDFSMNGTANQGQVTVYGATLDGKELLANAKKDSVGMWVGGKFSQTAAQSGFKAVGGNASGAYGLYIGGDTEIYGNFTFERTGNAASVLVGNASTVTIGNTAIIAPVIDLRDTTSNPTNDITGLLSSTGVINIHSDASLKPLFKNSASLRLNESTNNKIFLQSTNFGGITGLFAGADANGVVHGNLNPLFDYTAAKTTDLLSYEIAVTRINTIDIILQGYIGENTTSLLNGLTEGLVGRITDENELDGTLKALNDFYTSLENFETVEEMAAYATEAQKYLTNHGFTRLAAYAIQQLDVVENTLTTEMTFAQKMPYWQVWAKGVYNYSDNVKAKTQEFVKGKDDFSGFVLGAARDFRYITFGGQFHYLTGTVKSKNIYKADPDTFGIIVGARIHDVVNPKGTFNPWFDINFAYSRMEADQKRADLFGNQATSTVKSDMMRVSTAIGNTFQLSDIVSLTPQVGFDYTHISQKSYTEKHSDLALAVGNSNFDSFRPKVGAEVDVAISDVISAQFRAFYRYEAGDNRMVLNNKFAGAEWINFKTKGEKLSRSSGQLGVGFDVNFTETVSLGLDYDLWLRDQYTGHQFAVELRVNF